MALNHLRNLPQYRHAFEFGWQEYKIADRNSVGSHKKDWTYIAPALATTWASNVHVSDYIRLPSTTIVAAIVTTLDGRNVVEIDTREKNDSVENSSRFFFRPVFWAPAGWDRPLTMPREPARSPQPGKANPQPSSANPHLDRFVTTGRVAYRSDTIPPAPKSLESWIERSADINPRILHQRCEFESTEFASIPSDELKLANYGVADPTFVVASSGYCWSRLLLIGALGCVIAFWLLGRGRAEVRLTYRISPHLIILEGAIQSQESNPQRMLMQPALYLADA